MVLNGWEIELSRRNLYDFTRYAKPNFVDNWFHQKYYKKLDEFRKGKIKRLMVFVPPQHGKSEGSTRRLPAHMVGHNPNLKIGIASYSSTKARKFGREIKRIIQTPEYKQVFPDTKLAEGRKEGYQNAANEFEIVDFEGSIKLDGYNGAWTGDPIDVFILDDLYKSRDEALSPTINDGVISFWNSVAEARLHNDSQVLIVFTRWADNDLAGYLQKHEPEMWEVVKYPALKTGIPSEEDPRNIGEALLPFKHSVEKLERTKKRDSVLFESLYQQDPQPLAGLLFPKQELQFYDPSKFEPTEFESHKALSVDPADTGGDDLSAPFGYLIEGRVYIHHVIYSKEGTDITSARIIEEVIKRKMNYARIEGQAGGWAVYARGIRDKLAVKYPNCKVRIFTQHKQKHIRILNAAPFIRNNFSFRSDWESIPEYAAFMRCLMAYMKVQEGTSKNKHDDAPDSLSDMAEYFETTFPREFNRE